ncbi:Regulatory protein RecX [Geodia barretti]|uniref:Regulatory protein RecX n=1 Tax=Geodia barretti TaxID=519541 RepID=A0AA35WNJ8_GEOBA|nr:Regulatory protein RecX [Geodia barretti]
MNDGPAIDLAIHLESNDFSRARSAALRLLSARSRSVAEMRERLGKKFASEAVEQTVALLTAEGLLNDAAFAQQWRQSRERRKPRSSRMIEHELKQLGIADDIIDGAPSRTTTLWMRLTGQSPSTQDAKQTTTALLSTVG